jgi:serralysin
LRPDETGDAGLPNSFRVPDTAAEIFSDGGPEDSFPLAAGGAGGSISVSAAKPVATIAQLADYLVNGFWAYNSALSHHFASNTITYNISGLNAAEQFLAQSALAAWHDVANINFVQTSGSANITFTHNGTMTAYASASWTGSGATISATVNISTDWVTTDGGANDGKTGIDSYAYQTYIHEIGHALGLGHQGPYNGSANYSTNALFANDTWQYSVMSYFAEHNYSGSSYRYVVTPQMADIHAVATMYGAATTTRTGDTVYGFNSNAGAVYSFSAYTSAPALTIYDNGGSDTLDCSLYSSAQRIDLHAGSYSSVGGLTNNIGIALNAVIEKAIGGSGNDTLIASDLGCTLMGGAGADTLTGGTGIDRLIGGSGIDFMTGGVGADNFVFAFGDSSAASSQHDRLADFVSGTDRIDVSAIDAIAGTAALDLFRFLGSAVFDGAAGALNYFYNSSLGVTTLQGDTNGDRVADFAIDLTGNIALGFADLIGVTPFNPVILEAFGSTQLSKAGSNYYVSSDASTLSIKYSGTAIYQGQFGIWTPIAAEQTGSGYSVVLKYGSSDQYLVWSIDSNGNYISNTAPVSGSSSSLIALETSFQQDINGDGAIGLNQSIIEGFGSTQLSKAGSNYYVSSGASTLSIKYSGTPIYQGQFGIWTPIAAEQTGGGYSVVLKYGSSDQYLVWSIDSNGNYISNTAPVSGSSSSLTALETSFQQDINGDGTISGMALGNTELFALPKGTVQPVINANSAQSDLFEPTHQNDHLTAHSAWHLL